MNLLSKMRFLLAFLLTTTGLVAQDPVPKIQATFYTFQFAPNYKTVFLRTGAKEYTEIKLSTANMIGPTRVVSAGNMVTLHREDTDEEGKPIYPVIGTAKIKSGMSRVLIVLAPGGKKDKENAYQALVIDNRQTGFPNGSYKLVNMTPHPIRGAIGKNTRFQCKSGTTAGFKTQGNPGEVMPVLFQYNDGKRWRTLTETRWSHLKNERSLLCAYQDERTKRLKLRSIPDNTRPLE